MAEADPELIARLERGRLFFAKPWDILTSASSVASLPAPAGIEVAFAGRSNVGKSSLINALTGRKALARTSSAPGRTRELNFYGADAGITIVDMPGYGYARAPKADVAKWQALAFDYLRGRNNLRRVYLLVDARHGLKENDIETLKLLDKSAVSYQVVLTKADAPGKAELAATIADVTEKLAKRAAAHPNIIATSADAGTGIEALRAEIAAMA